MTQAQADQQALATFQQSYPSSEFLPTGTSAMQDWFHPAKGTLDDWLLANWCAPSQPIASRCAAVPTRHSHSSRALFLS